MSQEAVEKLLGRLITDKHFRGLAVGEVGRRGKLIRLHRKSRRVTLSGTRSPVEVIEGQQVVPSCEHSFWFLRDEF